MRRGFFARGYFFDKAHEWQKANVKRGRVRSDKHGISLSFKHWIEPGKADGVREIEVGVSDFDKTIQILDELGFYVHREQEKKRHTFMLGEVVFDIDTWPLIPSYVEIEGPSENALKDAAQVIGFNWNEAVFLSPKGVFQKYGIDLNFVKRLTFQEVLYYGKNESLK